MKRSRATSNLTNANADIVRLWWASASHARTLKQYRRVRLRTDILLDYLERLNMQYPKGRELDRVARKAIQEVLAELPAAWRPDFPDCRTVQEALDHVFELKSEIRRRALPDGLPARWDWEGDAEQ